jgi:hypothetical protein
VVKALYRAFAPAHGQAYLCIRHLLDEFQDQQVLPLRRQVTDQLQKGLLVLAMHEGRFGRLPLVVKCGGVVEGDLLVAAAIAVPVGDQVVGNAVQPGRERHAAVGIILNMMQGTVKDAGGQVLGIMNVAGTIVNVVKNPLDVPLVQRPERILVALRSQDQDFSIFQLQHLAHLTSGQKAGTPPDLRG